MKKRDVFLWMTIAGYLKSDVKTRIHGGWCYLILAGMCFFLQAQVFAYNQDDILFYCSFDGSIEPNIARGNKLPRSNNTFVFESGIKGQAVRLGACGNFLAYETEKQLFPDQGTMAFWVKPLNFDPVEPNGTGLYYLFDCFYDHNQILLLISKSRVLFQMMDDRVVKADIFRDIYVDGSLIGKWDNRQWTHIAMAWDFRKEGRIALYLNGEMFHEVVHPFIIHTPFFEETPVLFYVGPHVGVSLNNHFWSMEKPDQKSELLMDEFYIFRQPLTEMEIKNLFQSQASLNKAVSGPAGAKTTRHIITLPRSSTSPVIDGVIQEEEWSQSVSVMVMGMME